MVDGAHMIAARHSPPLSRIAGGVLTAGLLAAGLLACHDPAAPAGSGGVGSTPRLTLRVTRPPGDTLAQLGFDLSVGFSDTTPHLVRLYVDSGTADERRAAWGFLNVLDLPSHVLDIVGMSPGPGRHAFTVVAAADANGPPLASETFTYTIAVPDEAYTATALPDLGSGGGALGVASTGDVSGYVLTAAGRKRPAVWHAGVLRVLPVSDSVDVAAVRVNATGDVLLQSYGLDGLGTFNAGPEGARVWRADGTLLTIGTIGAGARACCSLAADLNDARQALGTNTLGGGSIRSNFLDVARAAPSDSTGTYLYVLNDAGQAAGIGFPSDRFPETTTLTVGFAAPSIPSPPLTALVRPNCGAARGQPLYDADPIDLDDAATLLVSLCGNAMLAPVGVRAQFVDRMIGPGLQRHLSRQGGLVAALDDSTGAIYLWRTSTGRVTRLRVAGGPWHLDSLAAVNAAGAIVGYGTSGTSGPGVALLLTPSLATAPTARSTARPSLRPPTPAASAGN